MNLKQRANYFFTTYIKITIVLITIILSATNIIPEFIISVWDFLVAHFMLMLIYLDIIPILLQFKFNSILILFWAVFPYLIIFNLLSNDKFKKYKSIGILATIVICIVNFNFIKLNIIVFSIFIGFTLYDYFIRQKYSRLVIYNKYNKDDKCDKSNKKLDFHGIIIRNCAKIVCIILFPITLIYYHNTSMVIWDKLSKTYVMYEDVTKGDNILTRINYTIKNTNKVISISVSLIFIICITPILRQELAYEINGSELISYNFLAGNEIVIPNKITTIGEYACNLAPILGSKFTSVTMPNSVTKIDLGAFQEQENLKEIIFSNSLEIIGENSFSSCINLVQIDLPNSLKIIEDRAFYRTGVVDVVIPDSVTYIGEGAFGFCSSLKTLTLPGSLTYISDDLFSELYKGTFFIVGVKNVDNFIPEESPLVLVKQDSYAESVCIKNGWNFDFFD